MHNKSDAIIGVFNADAGIKGEVKYLLGKVNGTSHCALCNVTHGLNPFGKKSWKQAAAQLPLPFIAWHLNEVDAEVAALLKETTAPAIFLRQGGETKLLLSAVELETCAGDAVKLKNLILDRL